MLQSTTGGVHVSRPDDSLREVPDDSLREVPDDSHHQVTHDTHTASHDELRDALRRVASTFTSQGIPFALAGSYALWSFGAPEPSHDVDFVVAEQDVDAAVAVLTEAGFDVRRPPEGWLFKVAPTAAGPDLVDVLHRINHVPVDRALLDRALTRDVLAVSMPVLPPTEIVIQKLRSLHEHHCDLAPLLPVLRAVREQLDWAALRERTADNPFAEAVLLVCRRLGLDGSR